MPVDEDHSHKCSQMNVLDTHLDIHIDNCEISFTKVVTEYNICVEVYIIFCVLPTI